MVAAEEEMLLSAWDTPEGPAFCILTASMYYIIYIANCILNWHICILKQSVTVRLNDIICIQSWYI